MSKPTCKVQYSGWGRNTNLNAQALCEYLRAHLGKDIEVTLIDYKRIQSLEKKITVATEALEAIQHHDFQVGVGLQDALVFESLVRHALKQLTTEDEELKNN